MAVCFFSMARTGMPPLLAKSDGTVWSWHRSKHLNVIHAPKQTCETSTKHDETIDVWMFGSQPKQKTNKIDFGACRPLTFPPPSQGPQEFPAVRRVAGGANPVVLEVERWMGVGMRDLAYGREYEEVRWWEPLKIADRRALELSCCTKLPYPYWKWDEVGGVRKCKLQFPIYTFSSTPQGMSNE